LNEGAVSANGAAKEPHSDFMGLRAMGQFIVDARGCRHQSKCRHQHVGCAFNQSGIRRRAVRVEQSSAASRKCANCALRMPYVANLSLTFLPANSYSGSLYKGGGGCSNASFTYPRTAPPFAASCSPA